MKRWELFGLSICLVVSSLGMAQSRRLWVMKEPSAIVEYDPTTFAAKQTHDLPPEVLRAPAVLQVNEKGQMLFAPSADDPSPDVSKTGERAWFWDGSAAGEVKRGFQKTMARTGSNQKVFESNPSILLSADGQHLYWFGNQYTRLERDNVDLSVTTAFRAWRTSLAGEQREEVAAIDLPECRCPTGSCTETCAELQLWAPNGGVNNDVWVTQIVPGQTDNKYMRTSRYSLSSGQWRGEDLPTVLPRMLDASADGDSVLFAIPDTGCCGWENQSDDQTVLLSRGKKLTVFDEREQYKNPDYDVSFYSANAVLSPDSDMAAMTIQASMKPGGAIQLSEDGQANPAESQRIRKALADLPAVQIVSATESGKRLAFLPHASFVGWLSEKEALIVENQVLVAYNVAAGVRRKSEIKASNPAFVIVR